MVIMSDMESFGWKTSTIVLLVCLLCFAIFHKPTPEYIPQLEVVTDTVYKTDTVYVTDTVVMWKTKPSEIAPQQDTV